MVKMGELVSVYKAMSGREMTEIIRDLGWTNLDLGMRVGAHRNTVTRWAKSSEVPGPVAAYLRLVKRLYGLVHEI